MSALPSDIPVIEILEILAAYGQQFGIAELEAEVEAIIGAVLSTTQALEPWRDQAEAIIAQIKPIFEPQTLADKVVDEAKFQMAKAAHHWRRHQRQVIFGVLNAYVQTFPEAFERAHLPELLTTLMPMMADWRVTRPEVRLLLQQIPEKFSVRTALRQAVEPEWIAIAQQLAHYRRHVSLENTVMSVVAAYRQKFDPEALTETLIEAALAQVLSRNGDADIALDLAEQDSRLVIKQIMFKMQLLKASPQIDKSAAAIAAQVNDEIERFKREEAKSQHPVDATQATHLGELEVGIEIHEA